MQRGMNGPHNEKYFKQWLQTVYTNNWLLTKSHLVVQHIHTHTNIFLEILLLLMVHVVN